MTPPPQVRGRGQRLSPGLDHVAFRLLDELRHGAAPSRRHGRRLGNPLTSWQCLLTTTGSRSGLPRPVPLGYIAKDGAVWVMAGYGPGTQWCRTSSPISGPASAARPICAGSRVPGGARPQRPSAHHPAAHSFDGRTRSARSRIPQMSADARDPRVRVASAAACASLRLRPAHRRRPMAARRHGSSGGRRSCSARRPSSITGGLAAARSAISRPGLSGRYRTFIALSWACPSCRLDGCFPSQPRRRTRRYTHAKDDGDRRSRGVGPGPGAGAARSRRTTCPMTCRRRHDDGDDGAPPFAHPRRGLLDAR